MFGGGGVGGGLGYVPSLHELSHRQIYEALSLYWHRRGRQYLLFVSAIQVSKKIYTPDTGCNYYKQNLKYSQHKPRLRKLQDTMSIFPQ